MADMRKVYNDLIITSLCFKDLRGNKIVANMQGLESVCMYCMTICLTWYDSADLIETSGTVVKGVFKITQGRSPNSTIQKLIYICARLNFFVASWRCSVSALLAVSAKLDATKKIIRPILFLYYEESLVSSNYIFEWLTYTACTHVFWFHFLEYKLD